MALMRRILLLLLIAILVTGKNLPQNDPEYDDIDYDAGSSLYDNDPGSAQYDDNEYDAGSSLYDAENDPGSA